MRPTYFMKQRVVVLKQRLFHTLLYIGAPAGAPSGSPELTITFCFLKKISTEFVQLLMLVLEKVLDMLMLFVLLLDEDYLLEVMLNTVLPLVHASVGRDNVGDI